MPLATDNSTPLATAKSFLACIKVRNEEGMRSLMLPEATACLIRPATGGPVYTMLDDIVNRICGVDKSIFMDEVSDNEVEHIDGPFATVWTPYRFYEPEEGKLHHSGANNFCLWKSPDKGWLITTVQDHAHVAEGVQNMNIIGGSDKPRDS